MKKLKYLVIAIVVVILSVYIYKNFIYYRIPFNPIKEYTAESLVDFHITQNLDNGKKISAKSHNPDTCDAILEYFSSLKLMPLTDKAAQKALSKNGNETYITGMLKFEQSGEIFISDIFKKTPNVIHISSSIDGFKGEGYYKIVDSKFDYKYIIKLIDNNEK